MKIGVMGTGYIGLTTGAALAYLGHEVLCQDIDQVKIQSLKEGRIPIFEPFLSELLDVVGSHLKFTTDPAEVVSGSDFVFIAVGTPSLEDGSPDLGPLRQAATQVGRNLGFRPTIVVNKSTVPIGGGNLVASMIREAWGESSPGSGEARFTVVSNPEFLKEGSALHDTFYPDRIVLGGEATGPYGLARALRANFKPKLRASVLPSAPQRKKREEYGAGRGFPTSRRSCVGIESNYRRCLRSGWEHSGDSHFHNVLASAEYPRRSRPRQFQRSEGEAVLHAAR